jgi:hypothetical protein
MIKKDEEDTEEKLRAKMTLLIYCTTPSHGRKKGIEEYERGRRKGNGGDITKKEKKTLVVNDELSWELRKNENTGVQLVVF